MSHSFASKVLAWFAHSGRKNLPWQIEPSPYKIWVSEIMLQQTQVSKVIPYFERFLAAHPTLNSLAQASLDEVLVLWAGLGYYARARNLKSSAEIIFKQYQGVFPSELDTLMALPGIGRSTAGAILSMGFHKPYPILDGNLKRVLARAFAIGGPINDPQTLKQLWHISTTLLPEAQTVGAYTQAMMDLGATLCTKTRPDCLRCPVSDMCLSYATQTQVDFPQRVTKATKPTKTRQMPLLCTNTAILMHKRPERGIWGGLWSLPECSSEHTLLEWCTDLLNVRPETSQTLDPIKHSFTHYHLMIHPVILKTPEESVPPPSYQWHAFEALCHLALPAPIKTLLQQQFPEVSCDH